VAALILEELDVETRLTPGDRGEFTVWVAGVKVAEKTESGFPDERTILHAVEDALPDAPLAR
jgi:hypothetical protein